MQGCADTCTKSAYYIENTTSLKFSTFFTNNSINVIFLITHAVNSLLLLGESSDTGKGLTLEKLKRSSSSSGNMGELVLGTVLLGDSGGISTTNDHGSTVVNGLDTGVKHSLGTLGEVVELKDTGGSVPEDGLGLANDLLELLDRLGTTVQTLPSVGDTLSVGCVANLGILGELVGGDVVDGEDKLDVVLLGLLNEAGDNLGSILVEERVSNLDVLKGLLEGESHTTTNDQGVDLVK